MPSLKHSKIYRGVVTSSYISFETSTCSARVNTVQGTLEIGFNMASKGGGTTNVSLRIGRDDFPAILEDIARKMPESVGMLSDCAAIANKQNLQDLEEARKVHHNEKTRAMNLIDDLEVVEEFVSEKYNELPAGEDEREAKVRDKIKKVITSLRQLK